MLTNIRSLQASFAIYPFKANFGSVKMNDKPTYTRSLLKGLEGLVAELHYALRYEKGHFNAGHCLLRQQRIILVSRFYTLEGKINALLDILCRLPIDADRLTDRSLRLYRRFIVPAKTDRPAPAVS